jgi:VIT1/CCC1 family predicted Fe2+/Mn2+ transporter
MPEEINKVRKPVLDPVERISELLFGLIMVLTFTGSLSAATAGREETRTMLFGAIGCNLAWGIVDAFMYLINTLTERGQGILKLRAVRAAKSPEAARRIIAEALPGPVASVLQGGEMEALRQRLSRLPEPPARPRLDKQDFLAAAGVFLIVFLSTFPVVIPFIFMHNALRALRISNAIAIMMLFLCGYRLGNYGGHRPWRMGLAMVIVGSVLVAITIALGG